MSTKLTKNRNNLSICFPESGDAFSLDVPHYKKWLSVIRFLKRRGFTVTENDWYKKQYTCLSPYHKIGFKRDVACLLEISRNSITIEFGHIKNLWKDMPQSFWSNPTDDRYTALTYLEGIAVKLEIHKLIKFCDKWGVEHTIDESELKTPEAKILHDIKTRSFTRNKMTSLDDIKAFMESDKGAYDRNYNSTDKNKKRIICGERKYFYDYNRRLCCGIVWHNINNMWWVISGNTRRNIASFDLFDFDASLPRRRAIQERSWSALLDGFAKLRDYKRCMQIQKYMDRNGILIDSHAKSTAA